VASGSFTRSIKFLTSTSSVTLSRHELDPQSGYRNVYSNLKKSYKYAFGSMLKGEQQFSWKPGNATTLTTGVTVERFFAIPQGADLNAPIESHDRPGTIFDTDIQDDFIKLRYSNSGAYAQLRHAITPRLTGVVGARGDYNTRYGATFNPRVGLVARPASDTTIKALYGTAYLAPSPYQAYSHYGSFYSTDEGQTYASEYWHLPNPNLRPQKKRTFEVNLVQGLGASFAVSATSFYSLITDVIQKSDPRLAQAGLYHGWPVAYIDFLVNEGNQRIYGATLGLNFVKHLSAGRSVSGHASLSLADGNVSQFDAIETVSRLPIGGMAPVMLKASVEARGDKWDVTPRVTAFGRQRLPAIERLGDSVLRRTLSGFATVDVTVRRSDVFKELDLFVTVENVLDARYRHINLNAYSNPEELVGAPQNPRRITVGAQIQVLR
jgi:outer membrane receptor protein involved in Fe transport